MSDWRQHATEQQNALIRAQNIANEIRGVEEAIRQGNNREPPFSLASWYSGPPPTGWELLRFFLMLVITIAVGLTVVFWGFYSLLTQEKP